MGGKEDKQDKKVAKGFRHRILSLEPFYEKHYKKLAIIPAIIALIAFFIILGTYFQTGDYFHKGISLQGGTTIRIHTNIPANPTEIETALSNEFSGEEFSVRIIEDEGIVEELTIETSLSGDKVEEIIPIVEKIVKTQISKEMYSIETIGSSLSESFFQETLKILLLAFILMGGVVLFYFRSPIPSMAVVLAAFFDMIITLAIINLLGIRLSTAGIAAFLMLIGYSIDADTMLTARILKRDAGVSIFEATADAFGTGLTMTAAALGASTVAFIFASSTVIKQIMLILIIGLIVDVFATWIQNAALIRWYLEAKK
jgi:preprotein translocase subunit SecF